MDARTLLAAAALSLGLIPGVFARELGIVSQPGRVMEARQRVYFKPFTEATGIAIQSLAWDGAMNTLLANKDPASSAWDVLAVTGDVLATGCDEGLLEKLDWSRIGGKDHYLAQGVSDCGVGTTMSNVVLAWDKDKFPGTPNWPDFWDVAKYPGKRGLRAGPKGNLEFALLADGVAQGDVYKVLRTGDGVDRAFRKLDQLRPYILWWKANDDAAKILSSGEVLMTSAPNGLVTTANRTGHRNFGLQWAGSLSEVESWAVVKGSENQRQAYEFLYIAGSSAIQARMLEATGHGGLAKGANDGVSSEIAALSPTSPANLAAALPVDEQFWRENQDKLTRRFDAWLTN